MNKIKKLKPLPRFKNEDEEFKFWQSHSSVDYFDWSKAKRGMMFPNLKLTSKLVTFRLPIGLVDRLKVKANSMDIPYQSLVKRDFVQKLDAKLESGGGEDKEIAEIDG